MARQMFTKDVLKTEQMVVLSATCAGDGALVSLLQLQFCSLNICFLPSALSSEPNARI